MYAGRTAAGSIEVQAQGHLLSSGKCYQCPDSTTSTWAQKASAAIYVVLVRNTKSPQTLEFPHLELLLLCVVPGTSWALQEASASTYILSLFGKSL